MHSVLVDVGGRPSSAVLDGVTLAAENSYSGGTTIPGGQPVVAAAPGALGTGDVLNLGTLVIAAPNVMTTSAVLVNYGTVIVGGTSGSITDSARGLVLPQASVLQLGDGVHHNGNAYGDGLGMALSGATLVLDAVGDTTEVTGVISFAGQSSIVLTSATNERATLAPAGLLRMGHGVLTVIENRPDTGTQPVLNVAVGAGLVVTNGILPAYVQVQMATPTAPAALSNPSWYPVVKSAGVNGCLGLPSFATVELGGIAPGAYVDMPVGGGTGREVVDVNVAPYARFISIPGLGAVQTGRDTWYLAGSMTLARDTSVYALRTNASLLNPIAGATTLRILGGGLIVGVETLNKITVEPDVDFGQAEGVINVTPLNYDGGEAELSNHHQ